MLIKTKQKQGCKLVCLASLSELENKLHPRKTNTHTANMEKELLGAERAFQDQGTMGENTAWQGAERHALPSRCARRENASLGADLKCWKEDLLAPTLLQTPKHPHHQSSYM